MRNRLLSVLALSLILFTRASAGDGERTPTRGVGARAAEVEKHVDALTTKISWQTSLDAAEALAKRDGKLVFWMHMLGDLKGST